MRAWQGRNRDQVREANRRSYQLHAEARLEQRRRRRERDGEDVRRRERERYAEKKGRPVRPYRKSERAGLGADEARRGGPTEPGR